MYEYLILDVETTTFQKGCPYSLRNKLCLVGTLSSQASTIQNIEYTDHSYKEELRYLQEEINQTTLLIGFNIKFDLAWLRRYGIDYSHCRVFDCQVCEFILSGQSMSYPSLNGVAEKYGLGTKLDEVSKLWEQGIDTPDIPLGMLTDYLQQDLLLTEQVYLKQLRLLKEHSHFLQALVKLSNQDLLVLLEMEWNGIKLDFEAMKEESKKVAQQMETIKEVLNGTVSDCYSGLVNWNSGDFVSCLLYGGKLTEIIRTQSGIYKSGPKEGLPRFKLSEQIHEFPRQVLPLKGSELKKEGFYATNEETLRGLKATGQVKKIIQLILELSKLEKLRGTYYDGLATLHTTKDWEESYIHGQFNQVVARTGRLSSSSPNLQNFPKQIDQFTTTRYV